MHRRAGRGTLALILPVALFVLFGMSRVAAPVGAIGLVFDEPVAFAAVALTIAVLGALLLFVRPVELLVARVIAGESRPPTDAEATRIDILLTEVSRKAGVRPGRLIVRVIDDPGANAAAGASHLLFVTSGALELDDDRLEAVLAHELGHHRGLHPVMAAVVWWLSLPGIALAAVYGLLRRGVASLAGRLGAPGRLVAVPLTLLLLAWQLVVMWVFVLGEVLAARASRISEYEADHTAARWGYAIPLAAAYESFAPLHSEPQGRLAALRASHPPLATRIARLRAHAASVVDR